MDGVFELKIKNILNRARLLGELPMKPLQDSVASQPLRNQIIPPNLYQTWETNLFGKTHLLSMQYFRSLNPELNFKLFNKDQRHSYMEEFWGQHPIYRVFKNAQFGPMKADIFRYCILYERGGFYFDISKGCKVSLNSLCPMNIDGLISYESHDCPILPDFPLTQTLLLHPDKFVLQWGMGFSKSHLILKKMIENICEYYPYFQGKIYESPKNAILRFTGPGMFSKSVREFFMEEKNIKIAQAGIDFNGQGIFALKGSEVRYLTSPSYALINAAQIVT